MYVLFGASMTNRCALILSALLIGCHNKPLPMSDEYSFITKPPNALTTDLYRASTRFEDVDDQMWRYLLQLVPRDNRSYKEQMAEMIDGVSPELARYFLTRGFDAERDLGGLESCFMHEDEDDNLLLERTVEAYESLGAFEHAAIMRELYPRAQSRLRQIAEADENEVDFNFDDGFWEPYEERWKAASESFDFYAVIWKDIQANTDRYVHP